MISNKNILIISCKARLVLKVLLFTLGMLFVDIKTGWKQKSFLLIPYSLFTLIMLKLVVLNWHSVKS